MASFTLDELKIITAGKCLQDGRRKSFNGVTIDSRAVTKGNIFIAIKGVNHDGHDFINEAVKRGAGAVVISKRISIPLGVCVVSIDDTTRALGLLAAAHRLRFNYPVIAVTGSAGKTTTKELIASVLRQKYRVLKNKGSLNNQWGVPLTLLKMNNRYQTAVLELGTNSPGEIDYLTKLVRPDVAVITNVGPCHLEELKTIDGVFREKKSIINGLSGSGVIIYNSDDRFLNRLKRLKKWQLCSYGLKKDADLMGDQIVMGKNGDMTFRVNKKHLFHLKSPVRENVSNALAAIACGRIIGVSFNDIRAGISRCSFKQQRQQIERFGGLIVINDCYNANPVSFKSALTTLGNFPSKGKKILVCGDMLELGKNKASLHRDLVQAVFPKGVDAILGFGQQMNIFLKAVKERYPNISTHFFKDIQELNRALANTVHRGDVVLIKGSRGMRLERCVEYLKAVNL